MYAIRSYYVPELGPMSRFERSVLHAVVEMRHGPPMHVVVAHLKSKRPKFLIDANGDPLEDRDDPRIQARATLRSVITSYSIHYTKLYEIRISQGFDSGSIEVVSTERADDIRLRLRADNAADFRQWFHFRVHEAAGVPLRMVFENATEAAYPDGWPDYRAVASYDREP